MRTHAAYSTARRSECPTWPIPEYVAAIRKFVAEYGWLPTAESWTERKAAVRAAVDVPDPARLTCLAPWRRDDPLVGLGRMVGQSTSVSPLAVT